MKDAPAAAAEAETPAHTRILIQGKWQENKPAIRVCVQRIEASVSCPQYQIVKANMI